MLMPIMQLTVLIFLHAARKFHKLGGASGLLAALNRQNDSGDGVICEHFEILVLDVKDIAGDLEGMLVASEARDYTKNLLRACAPKVQQHPQAARVRYLLIHKLTDFTRVLDALADGEAVRQSLVRWIRHLVEEEEQGRGPIRVFNKQLDSIFLLSDRTLTGELVRRECEEAGFATEGVLWPEFYKYDSLLEPLTYPVIIKPNDANNVHAHWMTVVTNNDQWPQLSGKPEFIKQQFYPHHGVLFKVYVIGEIVEIVVRPSISVKGNDVIAKDPISFHTHQFKSSDAALPAAMAQWHLQQLFKPHEALIYRFVKHIKGVLQMETFGVDIIFPEGTKKIAVIDINYFPGYDGVEDLAFKFVASLGIGSCRQ